MVGNPAYFTSKGNRFDSSIYHGPTRFSWNDATVGLNVCLAAGNDLQGQFLL